MVNIAIAGIGILFFVLLKFISLAQRKAANSARPEKLAKQARKILEASKRIITFKSTYKSILVVSALLVAYKIIQILYYEQAFNELIIIEGADTILHRGFLLHHWSTLVHQANLLGSGEILRTFTNQYGSLFSLAALFFSKAGLHSNVIASLSLFFTFFIIYIFVYISCEPRNRLLLAFLCFSASWIVNVDGLSIAPGFSIYRHLPSICILLALDGAARQRPLALLCAFSPLIAAPTDAVFLVLAFLVYFASTIIMKTKKSLNMIYMILLSTAIFRLILMTFDPLFPDEILSSINDLEDNKRKVLDVLGDIFVLGLFIFPLLVISWSLKLSSVLRPKFIFLVFASSYFLTNLGSPNHYWIFLFFLICFISLLRYPVFRKKSFSKSIIFGVIFIFFIKLSGTHTVGFHKTIPDALPKYSESYMLYNDYNVIRLPLSQADTRALESRAIAVENLYVHGDYVLIREKTIIAALASTKYLPNVFDPYVLADKLLLDAVAESRAVLLYDPVYFSVLKDKFEKMNTKNRDFLSHIRLIGAVSDILEARFNIEACESDVCRYTPRG